MTGDEGSYRSSAGEPGLRHAPPLHPFSMAEVLDRAFQVYRRHFTTMFLVAVVTFLPMGLLYMMVGEPVASGEPGTGGLLFWTVLVLALPVTAMGWGALAEVAYRGAVGRPARPAEALKKGLRVIVRVLIFGILLYVTLFLGTILVLMPVAVGAVVGAAGFGEGSAAALAVVGGTALVSLGVGLLFVVWWGALATLGLPVLVVEDAGVTRALRRAHTLSRAARIRVVALGIVAWLVVLLPTIGILLVFGMGSSLVDPGAGLIMTAREVYLQNALLSFTGVLTTPFVVSAMVYIYLDRRVRREGFDVELASASLGPER